MAILFDRNQRVCLHQSMLREELPRVAHAQSYARAMRTLTLTHKPSKHFATWILLALACVTGLGADKGESGAPTLDAKFTNKAQGFVLHFFGGWDLEDLGAPQPGRWDLLVVNPVAHKNNAGIHLTVYSHREDVDNVFRQLRTEYELTKVTKSVTEGTATVGGRQARHFVVQYAGGFELRYVKVYVVTTPKALYVFRCFMDDPEDAVTAGLLDAIVTEVSFR